MQALINALNQHKFQAFPQKQDPTKVSLTIEDATGKRYFLTREEQRGADGMLNGQWLWAPGKPMRDQVPAQPAPVQTQTVPMV